MDTILQKREERGQALKKAKEIADKAKAEKRSLTDEEKTEADGLLDKADALMTEIEALEADERRTARIEEGADDLARVPERRTSPIKPHDIPPDPERATIIEESRKYRGRLKAFEKREDAYISGKFIQAVILGDKDARKWCQDRGLFERRDMVSQPNTAGGYLVPSVLENTIIRLVEERGIFRRETSVVPMTSDTLMTPRRTGGATTYWVGENLSATITTSSPTVDMIELKARTCAALTLISENLSEDAIINVADFVAQEIGYGFANAEDNAGFLGDGTSTYGGILGLFPKVDDGNHAGSIYTALTGNTAFSTLDLVDFEGALGQLPQYAVANAKWYISRIGYYASMARLMDAAGGNTKDEIAGGSGLQFLGLPVVISQVLNATTAAQTSTVVCAVGDLRQASKLGDRRGVTIRALTERYAELLKVGIRGHERVDIVVHELGDATAAGSMIGLKTPGS